MTATTQDDGFHEIQLNGKQLVFLFMAATVVSVVIFLCGVLVGRGVRAERTVAQTQAEALAEPTADQPAAAAPAAPPQPTADVTKADAPPTADELSYPARLDKNHPAEEVKPDPPRTAAKAPEPAKPAAAAPPPAAAPAVKESAPQPVGEPPAPALAAAPPPGSGYAVQVAAVNVRSEADAIAKRLATKGYSTYVQVPAGAANSSVFRVRVGTFKTRREAESVAARLQKEEQIKPWVTR